MLYYNFGYNRMQREQDLTLHISTRIPLSYCMCKTRANDYVGSIVILRDFPLYYGKDNFLTVDRVALYHF